MASRRDADAREVDNSVDGKQAYTLLHLLSLKTVVTTRAEVFYVVVSMQLTWAPARFYPKCGGGGELRVHTAYTRMVYPEQRCT